MTVVLRNASTYRDGMPSPDHVATEVSRVTQRGRWHGRLRLVRAGVALLATLLLVPVWGEVSVANAAAPSSAPAVVRLNDPIADDAARALALLRIDVAGGGQLSSAYVAARSELAAKVGLRLWTPGEQFEQAWARADLEHQLAVLGALTQLGVPYKRNASLPGVGFDCSGLTTFAWSMAGFQLPRNSTAQIRAAEPRTFATAQAGDLVRYPGHVMMWLGVGQAIIHSPYPGRHVEIKFLGNRSMKRSKVGDPTE
jgi:cell wall-associated NlpC family hydrolase